jgi:hypothetical protein
MRGVRFIENLIVPNVQVVITKVPLIVGEIVHIMSGKGRLGEPKLLKQHARLDHIFSAFPGMPSLVLDCVDVLLPRF